MVQSEGRSKERNIQRKNPTRQLQTMAGTCTTPLLIVCTQKAASNHGPKYVNPPFCTPKGNSRTLTEHAPCICCSAPEQHTTKNYRSHAPPAGKNAHYLRAPYALTATGCIPTQAKFSLGSVSPYGTISPSLAVQSVEYVTTYLHPPWCAHEQHSGKLRVPATPPPYY